MTRVRLIGSVLCACIHLLLFNLRDDIGERTDRTAQRPNIVRRLRPLLGEWARSVDAEAKALK